MRRIFLLIILVTSPYLRSLTIEDCLSSFNDNHQIPQKLELLKQSDDDILQLFQKEWYPKLSLNGSYFWSANTMQIGFQSVENDKTLLDLTIQQPLYTGGAITLRRDIEILNNKIQQNSLEEAILTSKKLIYGLYFNILIVEQKQKITNLSLANLQETANYINIRLDSGKASRLDSLIIANLILTQEENLVKLTQKKEESIAMLNELLNTNIANDSEFSYPKDIDISQSDISRKELLRFFLREESYGKQKKLNNSFYLPKVNAFLKGSYGNPNYNLYANEWAENIDAGLSLNWNFWNWGQERDKNSLLAKQIKINNLVKEEFISQVNSELIKIKSNLQEITYSLETKQQQAEILDEITTIFKKSYELGKSDIIPYSEKLMENQQLKESIALLKLEKLYQKYIYNLILGEL